MDFYRLAAHSHLMNVKWVVGAIGFQTILILGELVSLARISAK
jgi:hypothetical protein